MLAALHCCFAGGYKHVLVDCFGDDGVQEPEATCECKHNAIGQGLLTPRDTAPAAAEVKQCEPKWLCYFCASLWLRSLLSN